MINQIPIQHRIIFRTIGFLTLPLSVLSVDAFIISNKLGDVFLSPIYAVCIFVLITIRINKLNKSKKWKPFEATVKSVYVTNLHCIGLLMSEQFYPTITYSYKVNGQTITSDKYSLYTCNHLCSEEKALEEAKKIKKQKKISVFVNPTNVKQAVVQQGASSKFIYFLYAQIFISVMLIVMYMFLKTSF